MSKVPGSSVASLVNLAEGMVQASIKGCKGEGTIGSVVSSFEWVGTHNITRDGQIQLVVEGGENIPTEVIEASAKAGMFRSRKGGGTGTLTIKFHIEVNTDDQEESQP